MLEIEEIEEDEPKEIKLDKKDSYALNPYTLTPIYNKDGTM